MNVVMVFGGTEKRSVGVAPSLAAVVVDTNEEENLTDVFFEELLVRCLFMCVLPIDKQVVTYHNKLPQPWRLCLYQDPFILQAHSAMAYRSGYF